MSTNFLCHNDSYDTIHDEQLSSVVRELDLAVSLAKGQHAPAEGLSALKRHTRYLELLLQKALTHERLHPE